MKRILSTAAVMALVMAGMQAQTSINSGGGEASGGGGQLANH